MNKSLKPIAIATILSAFFGPGAGQLYNKQWKKGAVLIFITLLMIGWLLAYFVSAIKKEIPLMANMSPVELGGNFEIALTRRLLQKNQTALAIFKWSFIFVWCYSIVDAYLGAKNRATSQKTNQEVPNPTYPPST